MSEIRGAAQQIQGAQAVSPDSQQQQMREAREQRAERRAEQQAEAAEQRPSAESQQAGREERAAQAQEAQREEVAENQQRTPAETRQEKDRRERLGRLVSRRKVDPQIPSDWIAPAIALEKLGDMGQTTKLAAQRMRNEWKWRRHLFL